MELYWKQRTSATHHQNRVNPATVLFAQGASLLRQQRIELLNSCDAVRLREICEGVQQLIPALQRLCRAIEPPGDSVKDICQQRRSKRQAIEDYGRLGTQIGSNSLHGVFGSALRTRVSEINRDPNSLSATRSRSETARSTASIGQQRGSSCHSLRKEAGDA